MCSPRAMTMARLSVGICSARAGTAAFPMRRRIGFDARASDPAGSEMRITLAVCPRCGAPPIRGAPDATVKSGVSAAVDEPQELGARACVFAESSEHRAGDHGDTAFVHAPRGHALMNRIDHHGNATWPQHAVDAVCDLCSELLLYLEAAG